MSIKHLFHSSHCTPSSWPLCLASVGLRPHSLAPGQSSGVQTIGDISEQYPPGAKERREAERRQARRRILRGYEESKENHRCANKYICKANPSFSGTFRGFYERKIYSISIISSKKHFILIPWHQILEFLK